MTEKLVTGTKVRFTEAYLSSESETSPVATGAGLVRSRATNWGRSIRLSGFRGTVDGRSRSSLKWIPGGWKSVQSRANGDRG